jgi:hypothetical protein
MVIAAAPEVLAQVGSSRTPDAEYQLREEAAAQETARQQELVSSVIAAREAAAARKFSPALRASLMTRLSSAPASALETFANAGGLGNTNALVPNVFGAAAADLVFTPVTPCRIVNTVAIGTPLAANTSRQFYVNGNAASVFEAQGGNPGGCGIPDTATAVEMNFIAVGPAGAGDLRAFPWAASPTIPNSSVINYANVGGLNIANGLAQPVCNAATTVCSFDLIVQADVAQSHLIIDVVGYYSAPSSLPTAGHAYAVVENNAAFDAPRTKGFSAVARPATGVYCLTPSDAAVTPVNRAYSVTVDWGKSAGGENGVAEARAISAGCPSTAQFEVRTFVSGVASNSIGFHIFVP